MYSFCAVLLVFTLATFSVAYGATTIKDVKKCLKENIEDITKTCEDKLPGKVAEFKKCIADDSKDGLVNGVTECLKGKGVTEDDNCIVLEAPGGKRANEEITMFLGLPLPFDTVAKLVPFLECAKTALLEKESCTKGCANASKKVTQAIVECSQAALPRPGGVSSLAECIRKISL